MTAVCGGGASAPKVGAAAVVDYSAGLLAAIFAAYDIAWLIPVIPLVGLAPLTLSTFCASDPPAVPTFTSAETAALLTLQFGSTFDSAIGKLKDWALNAIWYDACQCTSGALAPLVPPVAPTGTPIFQPPVAPIPGPCKTEGSFPSVLTSGQSFSFRNDIIYTGLNATSVLFHAPQSPASGAGLAVTYHIEWDAFDGTQVGTQQNFTVPANTTNFSILLPVRDGTASVGVHVTAAVGAGSENTAPYFDVFCSGATPGVAQTPCCPPDTATQAYLDLILKMVTLTQRQLAPFAYVLSTAHAGLSGAGSFAISGLLGMKLALTTVPSALGESGSAPLELFDAGYVTFGTADGYPHSVKVEHNPQLVLPPRCSAFTEFAYDLHPGVVLTATEVLREP